MNKQDYLGKRTFSNKSLKQPAFKGYKNNQQIILRSNSQIKFKKKKDK